MKPFFPCCFNRAKRSSIRFMAAQNGNESKQCRASENAINWWKVVDAGSLSWGRGGTGAPRRNLQVLCCLQRRKQAKWRTGQVAEGAGVAPGGDVGGVVEEPRARKLRQYCGGINPRRMIRT